MKRRRVYDFWKEYDNFIRSIHLKSVEKKEEENRKRRLFNYAIKLLIIFFASFFTTLTFQFFINPNKLFNSGINGIIQVLTNNYFLINNINEKNYVIVYYALVFLVNLLIVSSVHWFFPENIEVNSTAIFYILFQFIWSNAFKYSSLQNYIFTRFAPETWSNLSSKKQLGLTLPFYITIAIVSSITHTFGYSLIYQAKSTPGGLEIITSTLSQNEKNKKNKNSIGYLNKMFGILVVFLITLFNFFFVEDNIALKRNELIVILNKDREEQDRIRNQKNLDDFLTNWVEKNDDQNTLNILKKWSDDGYLQEEPWNIFSYLKPKKDLLKDLLAKKKMLSEIESGEIENKSAVLNEKIKDLELNIYERNLLGYLKYITNDEKLWASLVYIFFSSYLINQLFPKNKLVYLNVIVENRDDLNLVLGILGDCEITYFKTSSWKNGLEEESYILNCLITKWNYQLLAGDLSKIGKVLVSTIDETN